MGGVMSLPATLGAIGGVLDDALVRVEDRFERQLASDLPPIGRLCGQIARYRGKMLRPTLAVLSSVAATGDERGRPVADDVITVATVCEMVHMATLVHDDVLDESDTRRGGPTVNQLHGNEAAVILGDYLIAASFHLCSQLDDQTVALRVGRVSMTLCEGELLQLSRRNDLSLDEPTYHEIIERKTASLVGLACRLGAERTTRDTAAVDALERFGAALGVAFQIQDDLLDLTGGRDALGKPVRQDVSMGKLTLPVIHHLARVTAQERGEALELLDRAHRPGQPARRALDQLVERLSATGSVEHARRAVTQHTERARAALECLPQSPARSALHLMADALGDRTR